MIVRDPRVVKKIVEVFESDWAEPPTPGRRGAGRQERRGPRRSGPTTARRHGLDEGDVMASAYADGDGALAGSLASAVLRPRGAERGRSGPPGARRRTYQAGPFHRMLFGSGYRKLWATPIEVEVLDLAAVRRRPHRRGRRAAASRRCRSRSRGATGTSGSSARSTRIRRPCCPSRCSAASRTRSPRTRSAPRCPRNALIVDALAEAAGIIDGAAPPGRAARRRAAGRVPQGVRRHAGHAGRGPADQAAAPRPGSSASPSCSRPRSSGSAWTRTRASASTTARS